MQSDISIRNGLLLHRLFKIVANDSQFSCRNFAILRRTRSVLHKLYSFWAFFFYFRKQFSLFLNGCTFMFLLTEMRHLIFYLPFWSHILHLIHSQNKNECETLSTDFIFFLIFKTCKKNIRKLQNPVWIEN